MTPQSSHQGSPTRAPEVILHDIPEAAARRLARYLHMLRTLGERGEMRLSSTDLATAAGVNPAILRKDLSHVGAGGVRGVGYDVARLTAKIALALGLERSRNVALAGAGYLGRALIEHAGFGRRGFNVVAVFETQPDLIGTTVDGAAVPLIVQSLDEIVTRCPALQVEIAVLATKDVVAQDLCDQFIDAGVTQILNFTGAALSTPDDVEVRPVDLALELQVLASSRARHGGTRSVGASA